LAGGQREKFFFLFSNGATKGQHTITHGVNIKKFKKKISKYGNFGPFFLLKKILCTNGSPTFFHACHLCSNWLSPSRVTSSVGWVLLI
jgi:hypothetical protein